MTTTNNDNIGIGHIMRSYLLVLSIEHAHINLGSSYYSAYLHFTQEETTAWRD